MKIYVFIWHFLSFISLIFINKFFYSFFLIICKIVLRLIGFNNPNPNINGEYYFIKKILNKNSIYIDVGFNDGSHLKKVISKSKVKKIIAYDLMNQKYFKSNVEKIKSSLDKCGQIFFINKGISDKKSTNYYYSFLNQEYSGSNSLDKFNLKINKTYIPNDKGIKIKKYKCSLIPASDILFDAVKLFNSYHIDLIKFDIEGHDLIAVFQLLKFLQKNKKYKVENILFEINKATLINKSISLSTLILDSPQYTFYRILPYSLIKLDTKSIYDDHFHLNIYQNILIKRN